MPLWQIARDVEYENICSVSAVGKKHASCLAPDIGIRLTLAVRQYAQSVNVGENVCLILRFRIHSHSLCYLTIAQMGKGSGWAGALIHKGFFAGQVRQVMVEKVYPYYPFRVIIKKVDCASRRCRKICPVPGHPAKAEPVYEVTGE